MKKRIYGYILPSKELQAGPTNKWQLYRSHESLDNLTPLEYAQQIYFKVLPMWSSLTSPCRKMYGVVYLHYLFFERNYE